MTPAVAAPSRARRRPRARGRPAAADSAALPGHLLDAAQQVFVDHGYARATMDAIARAAGVTRKTLYARWPNKAEVMREVVNRLLDAALAPSGAAASQAAPADPRRLLLEVGRELGEVSSSPQVAGLNRLILAEAARLPELARLFVDLYERAIDKVGAVLTLLRAQGHLPGITDLRAAATLFIEMTASVPRLRAMLGLPPARAQLDAQVRVAVDLFIAGYGGKATRTSSSGA